MLIYLLPLGIKSTKPEQLATLNKLEAENQQLTQELRHTLDVSGDHPIILHQKVLIDS
jgi:hypothetical protein